MHFDAKIVLPLYFSQNNTETVAVGITSAAMQIFLTKGVTLKKFIIKYIIIGAIIRKTYYKRPYN